MNSVSFSNIGKNVLPNESVTVKKNDCEQVSTITPKAKSNSTLLQDISYVSSKKTSSFDKPDVSFPVSKDFKVALSCGNPVDAQGNPVNCDNPITQGYYGETGSSIGFEASALHMLNKALGCISQANSLIPKIQSSQEAIKNQIKDLSLQKNVASNPIEKQQVQNKIDKLNQQSTKLETSLDRIKNAKNVSEFEAEKAKNNINRINENKKIGNVEELKVYKVKGRFKTGDFIKDVKANNFKCIKKEFGTDIDENLVDQLKKSGISFDENKLLSIEKDLNNKIVFLELGSQKAGFIHVLEHIDDFHNKGVDAKDIPKLLMDSLSKGKIVGIKRSSSIYQIEFQGKTQTTLITVGSNGFIVGANPITLKGK